MAWPSPPLTSEESALFTKIMAMDCTVDEAAAVLETSSAQAAAVQKYVIMVCALRLRMRRAIPHEHLRAQAKTILRCMAPAMRNKLPEALRYGCG